MEEIISYIERKIRNINRNLKNNGIDNKLNAIEYFLVVMSDASSPLSEEKVEEVFNNLSAFKYVMHNYNLVSDNELKDFDSCIRRLMRKDASFNVNDFTNLSKITNKLIQGTEIIQNEYDNLTDLYHDMALNDEKLLYDKMLLEYTLNDIENEMILSDTLIYDYIKNDVDISDSKKQKMIIKLIEYNEYAMKNYVPMSIMDVKNLLKDYGVLNISNESVERIIGMYKLSILKDILNTISELNIRFSEDVLVKILESGTSSKTIKEAYNILSSDTNYSLASSFNIPTFWIERVYDVNRGQSYRSSIVRKGSSNTSTTSTQETINSKETFETANYLRKFPFYKSDFGGMHSILSIPVSNIIQREKLLALYEITPEKIKDSTTLVSSRSSTILDQFIELGEKKYIFDHIATISRSKKIPLAMYILKKHGINPTRITENDIRLVGDISELNEKSYEELSNMIGINELVIQNRSINDNILNVNNPNKILPTILNNSVIRYIEQNNKISTFEYKFGDFIISRKKVLRLASSLIKDDYISFDSFMYIISYQSILDRNDAIMLESILKQTYAYAMGRRI